MMRSHPMTPAFKKFIIYLKTQITPMLNSVTVKGQQLIILLRVRNSQQTFITT